MEKWERNRLELGLLLIAGQFGKVLLTLLLSAQLPDSIRSLKKVLKVLRTGSNFVKIATKQLFFFLLIRYPSLLWSEEILTLTKLRQLFMLSCKNWALEIRGELRGNHRFASQANSYL